MNNLLTDTIIKVGPSTYTTSFSDGIKDRVAKITYLGTEEKPAPNINTSLWDDEVFINLNYKKMIISDEKEVLNGSNLDLVSGDETFSIANSEEGTDLAIKFASKPIEKTIELGLTCSLGLQFDFQPATLTAIEEYKNSTRPDNARGSYTIYHYKKDNKYATGKLGHLYKWKVTDALGNSEWCEPLNLRPFEFYPAFKKSTLEIGLPRMFMNDAIFPVIATGG